MKIRKSIFLCFTALISLFSLNVNAQEADSSRFQAAVSRPLEFDESEEVSHIAVNHDLRLGIDIHNYILGAISPYRTGLDLNIEYNLSKDLFVIIEGGYNYFRKENIRINYVSEGKYIRLGVDYNLREPKEANDKDIYYIGARLAYSQFTQEVPKYLLVNGYWGNSTAFLAKEDAFAYWAELLTGFKVEVLKNWYLGMGLRLKFLLHRSKGAIEPVQFIPGYSQNYNSAVMDFNYTISYNIPLNYKKKKIAVYEEK